MVSPSKTKHSRVAANQQQKPANASKVKLVKGPTPLVHHRFYLDIQKHQLASKIEYTIKELGGQIEFFLSKDITHFITDKDYSQYQRAAAAAAGQDPDGGPSNSYNNLQQPVTPTTPLTPKTPLSNRHHHLQQYVNEASPSSPSCGAAAAAAAYSSFHPTGSVGATSGTIGGSESRPSKPAAPRSRADAMLQRVRQQQQQQNQHSPSGSYNPLLASTRSTSRPCSPLSPSVPSPSPIAAATPAVSSTVRLDRNSQSPAQLAKSWGKPIWSTEYAIKFLSKVIGSVKQDQGQNQQHQSHQQVRKGSGKSGDSAGKTTPQHLRGDYIKIESHQRHHYRPAFALFKAWPSLNLSAKSNHSPFDSTRGGGQRSVQPSVQPGGQAVQEDRPSGVPKTVATNQTNATTATAKPEDTQQNQQQQCGYCEICRIEYDVLANHLNADEHRAFVRNDTNFVALDQLITDGGVGLGAFLLKSVVDEEEQRELTNLEEEPSDEAKSKNKDTVEEEGVKCDQGEVKAKKRRVEKKEEPLEQETVKNTSIVQEKSEDKEEEVTKPALLKTYSRKSKEKPATLPEPVSTPPAKRTYAGRKTARAAAVAAPTSPPPAPEPAETPAESAEVAATDPQMFGRRSAIHHHPHNTLNHHNHQKAKAARQAALELKEKQEQVAEDPAVVTAADVVMKLHGTEQTKQQQQQQNSNSKMGMKQSSVKSPSAAVAAAELMECDGLDPKNTKRISLGLRQNPKRANLNEDFTSLLDETLEPIRKPRIRRESVRRVNYSEPREDEIASQEELIESILLESTAQEAIAAAAAVEDSCRGKKKSAGSPKRSSGSDVKIRGIRWRAPSPQSRPPVKSPLLYKVIEEPKPKSKKNNSASPTKDTSGKSGSPTKATKNGLIVKIRRVRQSELSLLNDEAENFMFPKSNDSSDDETDEDRQTSSETGPGDYSQEIPSSDYDHHNSSKRKSAGTPLPTACQLVRKRPSGRPPADSSGKRAAKESTPTPASDNETTSASTPRSRRAGVRGVAALLHDNAEYYKFPDPGSRLRFPEAPIQPNPAEVDDEEVAAAGLMTPPPPPPPLKRRGRKPAAAKSVTSAVATTTATTVTSAELRQQQDLLLATRGASGCSSPYQHQEQLSSCGKAIINYCSQKGGKEDGMGAMFKWSTFMRNCEQIEPYRFAFERVPSLEPWYETFQRQDESSEKMYEYFGNTAYRKLPYEMGGLPPLRQNCCILNYRMKSKTPESTVPSSSNSSTCDGATTTATTTTTTKDQPAKPTSSSEPLSLPLKKRKLLVDSDRPRKSPREHASTLAILSLLQQQQQHNRRRTISGGSSVPLNLPPPSPVPSSGGYSPKKEAIKQQMQQEADSALGDEIRSSCGSDPVTEKDEPVVERGGIGAKKIKFDPPIMPEQSFVNYKVMCQQLEEFLDADGALPDLDLPETVPKVATPIVVPPPAADPLKKNLLRIVQACDKEPPLSLKLVSRHESIVRKIVQYDRRPRPLSAISIKSFDGGGGSAAGSGGTTGSGPCLGIFKKRINRTGWPNVKKRIVTRKQHQQKGGKRDSAESAGGAGGDVKKEEPEDTSRKSSTEESQVSAETGVGEEEEAVKQEVDAEEGEGEDEDEDDDDEDEFEDTMTMLDPEEEPVVVASSTKTNGETKKEAVKEEEEEEEQQQQQQLLTDDEEGEDAVEEVEDEERKEEVREEQAKKETEEPRQTPEPSKTEEILIPSRPCGPRSSSSLPSSKYVTKTTTTMTRIDYNVPASTAEPPKTATVDPTSVAAAAEECDSISSRSIFVSDDCDTTSSTLINMEADPLALPCTPPVDAVENQPQTDNDSRPETPTVARSRQNSARHVGGSPGKKRGNLQPIVCLQKINCATTAASVASSMRTRSSSRTPIKKTYKRSVFTSALVNSAGKPLKKKRKRKKLKLINGNASASVAGTSSPSCSDGGHNSSSVADEPTNDEDEDEDARTDGTDSPRPRGLSTKNRPPTPSPVKFSPRKLRKPRGRWYRER